MTTIPEAVEIALQHHRAGRLQEAEALYREILQVEPNHPDALHLLGVIAHHAGRHEVAADLISKAIAINPAVAEYHNNIGEAYRALGRSQESEACYRRALALKPDYAEAFYNLGLLHSRLRRLVEAEACYRQALAINSAFAEAHNNLGNVLMEQGKAEEAAAHYRQALALKPDFTEAYNNLGAVLQEQGRLEEAVGCFRQALALKPDYAEAENQLMHQVQHLCEWSRFDELVERQRQRIRRSPASIVAPFTMLCVPCSPAEQLACARNWVANRLSGVVASRARLGFHFTRAPKPRLRLGYLSADFREHPVAHLIAELFELHDRTTFEVCGYSYGPDDGGPTRARIARACDRFVDIRADSFEQAAGRIHADGVDILIDLTGYTQGARTEIVALRPAPVQVNYLGYTGTMGAEFIDYMLTDKFITPPGRETDYAEALVYLPECWLVHDRKRQAAERTPARTEYGLPEDGFVYCCFNSPHKIIPAVFDAWMRVLTDVPDSVLWLLESNSGVSANLRREAQARGVDPARLVFAPKIPVAQHLARFRLANLFLDTVPFNAHLTASEALWAGLPVLTCPGETFASRVAGSLLRAIGLPELITASLADYEAAAVRLARNPAELSALRDRLTEHRLTMPLFDSARYTRHLERAYRLMWDSYVRGESPRPIEVPKLLMATISEDLNLALQHHQAGRLQEAEAIYRQILEVQPANHAALHYLGLIAHHVGKPQIAVDYMSRAIAIYPNEATYHNNLGEVYRVSGNEEKAMAHFEQATVLKPDYADAHYNLGVVLQFQKKPEEAAASYRKALSLQPNYSRAHNNLGNILREQGRVEDALVHYREALAADPVFIEAHNNLGAALQAQGKLDEAAVCYRQAVAIKPDFAEAYSNLGIVLQMQGNLEEAAAHYRQALTFKPGFADGYCNLASVFQTQGKMEEAVEHYRKALQLRPAFPKAAKGLGFVLKLQGKLDDAVACYRQCLDVAPTDGLRILLGTSTPVIYRSKDHLLQARRTFQNQVAGLLCETLSVRDPGMEVDATNFFLAYQGMNDLNLQMKVAKLYEQACPSLQYTADHCRSSPSRPAGGKIKIGFISMYFTNHTVGQLMRGIMARLSRELFSVSALTFPHKPDWISGLIAKEADHTLVLLPTSLDAVRRRIAEERFDILFYADIGMDPFTYYLAFSRLAPVQCTTWGHPVTTGIKTMDYFVSSKLIESDDAGRHYSERLIRLKHVPSYYYRPTIVGALKSRRELGFSESLHLYLCPQSLFKIHPDFDAFIAGILQADPHGELILIDGTSMHWNTLLMERFRETIPHVVERIRFVPRMSGPDFLGLLSAADVILDPLHWSGGNTTYEALFFGTPVVTLPSKFMRGRVTGGLYRQMGVMDCVVSTKDKYVKLAVRLGTDPTYREKIKAKILAANHVLYENMEVVRDMERFFVEAVETAQHAPKKRA